MINEELKQLRTPIFIACFQWFFSTLFQVDRLFFTYDVENNLMIAIKIIYLISLIGMWSFLFRIHVKIKNGDLKYKRAFCIFIVYFVILMFILLILWPGTWAWDDIGVIYNIRLYEWVPWQHIITSIYQMVLLQILPFPGGVILLQNIIIAICVAFVVTKLETTFRIQRIKITVIDFIVKLLPFLLPPVLMYQFSGYRIGLYVYLELVMLVMLICAIKDNKEWSWIYILLFSLVCVITAAWRTESFFYIPCVSLALLFISKNVLSNKKKIVIICLLISGFWGINTLQSSALGNSSYEIMSILRPCVEVVHASDKIEDAELLSDLSKVLNLDVIYNNPEVNGEILYWNYGVVKKGYTDKDYNACLKAFVKLCLKYPNVVIAERFNIFAQSTNINGTTCMNVDNAATLFDSEYKDDNHKLNFLSANWITNKPIFKNMRKTFIYALGLKNSNGEVCHVYRLVWNALFPILILLYAWLKSISEKKWYVSLLLTAILIRLPIVALTEPAGWIMYLLSFYFLGYVLLVYGILYFMGNKKSEPLAYE